MCCRLIDGSLFHQFNRLCYSHLLTLSDLSQSIETFITDAKSFNNRELTKLSLENYPNLRMIDIGDESFIFVTETIIQHLPRLETIEIGVSSFFEDQSPHSCCLTVRNCARLRDVFLHGESFSSAEKCIFEGFYKSVYSYKISHLFNSCKLECYSD